MKGPVGSFPDPITGQESVTKAFADATYLGGSSDPVAAARGAYLSKKLGSDQVNIVTNDTIAFDTVVEQQGDISSSGDQFADLKAGRTYFLIAHGRRTDGTFVTVRWYDATGAVFIGGASVYDDVFQSTGVHAIFTPLVDSTVELRAEAASGTPDIQASTSLATVIEIGAVQANVIGGLEFVDRIVVGGSAVQTVAFGTGGDGDFQRALDGDVDEEYILVSMIRKEDTLHEYTLRPNGQSTNTRTETLSISAGSTAGSTSSSDLRILNTSFTEAYIETKLQAKTGNSRLMISMASINDLGQGVDAFKQDHSGVWEESVTNLTSLEVHCPDGAFIDPGSTFSLFRRTSSNLRADSAAVYERNAIEVVDPGAIATTERTTGHSTYGGSVVGLSARVEDAVTAGTITCNVKVDGVTVLTAVLDTTNSTSRVVRAPIGVHKFAADKNISVEFVPSAYDNAGSVPSSVTVQVHLTNDALIIRGLGDVGASTEKFTDSLSFGNSTIHDSDTPKIVSQREFDPTDYDLSGATRSLIFRAIASNVGGVASTNVQLYSVTDAEIIATLNYTSATATSKESVLTEGAGAGEIDLSAKIYEVRIFVDAPDAVDDQILLGSAELLIVNTID